VVNRLARLSVCTREEQRSVIRFLWAEGVKGAEIHARLCTQYGNNALPRRNVYEWIEIFENGRTSVMDAERSGRPSTSTTDEKLEEARAITLTDRRVTIEEIALQLGISQGMASYGTPHHQHHSATELGSPRAPCLQPRPGPFRFPSVWTPQERSRRSSICS